jgi:hypothetical protein
MIAIATIACILSVPAATRGKLDIAAGPSFHRFDSPLSDIDPWIPGFNLDAGVAVSAETARAKAPKRWKRRIPKDGEIVVRPLWLSLLPRQILLSPGGKLTTIGATWEPLGIGGGLELAEGTSFKAGLSLPEIAWIGMWGPSMREDHSLVAIGVTPDLHLQFDPSSWLRLDLGWAHHLDLPFGSFGFDRGRLVPWSWGSAYLQLHLRPGISI